MQVKPEKFGAITLLGLITFGAITIAWAKINNFPVCIYYIFPKCNKPAPIRNLYYRLTRIVPVDLLLAEILIFVVASSIIEPEYTSEKLPLPIFLVMVIPRDSSLSASRGIQ